LTLCVNHGLGLFSLLRCRALGFLHLLTHLILLNLLCPRLRLANPVGRFTLARTLNLLLLDLLLLLDRTRCS